MTNLAFTGERLVPGVYGKIAIEHLHRYAITAKIVKDKKVLDIACGEGYGSNLLADYAEHVIGVDISEEVIHHAQTSYCKSNLAFKQGSALKIPFESAIFDVVVSFETLEHVTDHQKMISELKRVLKPDGILIISTPEKSTYSDEANYANPFHEKELYEDEFLDLIKSEFKYSLVYYQKYLNGSLIVPKQENGSNLEFYSGDYEKLDIEIKFNHEYCLAICSNFELKYYCLDSMFLNQEFQDKYFDELLNNNTNTIKSYFRYRLIDFLFKPIDLFKIFVKKLN